MTQCTGKNRQGEQCKHAAINGTTKCRFHGGAKLGGLASPTFKTGSIQYAPAHTDLLPATVKRSPIPSCWNSAMKWRCSTTANGVAGAAGQWPVSATVEGCTDGAQCPAGGNPGKG